jgi:Xaa-Pro aminopeptidase
MASNQNVSVANIERLNQLMDENACSAVVARSGKNFTYLAGFAYPGTLARHLDFPDSPRGVLVIWPRQGNPVMVVNETAAPLARRDGWIEDVRLYDGYAESAYAKTAEILAEMRLQNETIALEKDYLSMLQWEEMASLLPNANLTDCTDMMDRVRWIKTPEEVELLKKGADLLDEVYLEVFPTVRPGDTERDVHARIVEGCIRRGANWVHGILNTSRNDVAYGGEGDMAFQSGDIIRNDYVSYLNGYPGHQSRTVVIGEPTKELLDTYKTHRDIYRATINMCRPGAKSSDIYHFSNNSFNDAGFKGKVNIAGHGVGAWWHQQEPYMVPSGKHILEKGMVVALEPHIGHWHLQDMVLVTDSAPLLLSPLINTDEMMVAG